MLTITDELRRKAKRAVPAKSTRELRAMPEQDREVTLAKRAHGKRNKNHGRPRGRIIDRQGASPMMPEETV